MTTGADRPRIGTALRDLLRGYLEEVRDFDQEHGDRITRQLIDCAEFILIEDER